MPRLVTKHSRATRWHHWVNFPTMALMVGSGLLIYWANDVYRIGVGSWTLVPIDEGKKTFVTYKIRVKPKINLPSSWVTSAGKSTIKDVILRMRENVKKPK